MGSKHGVRGSTTASSTPAHRLPRRRSQSDPAPRRAFPGRRHRGTSCSRWPAGHLDPTRRTGWSAATLADFRPRHTLPHGSESTEGLGLPGSKAETSSGSTRRFEETLTEGSPVSVATRLQGRRREPVVQRRCSLSCDRHSFAREVAGCADWTEAHFKNIKTKNHDAHCLVIGPSVQ